MKFKHLLCLILLFSPIFLFSQNKLKDKIILNTGDVYIGEIIVKNSEIIMIQTDDGNRFQFPVPDIKFIGKATPEELLPAKTTSVSKQNEGGNIRGVLEISGNFARISNLFEFSPAGQISLTFGSNITENFFLGLGAGYFGVKTKESGTFITYSPIFIRLKSELSSKKIVPFGSLDAGYSFMHNSENKGGLYLRGTLGMDYKISSKTSLMLGLFAASTGIQTDLTEDTDNGSYTYYGTSSIQTVGLSLGLQF
ncbi:MAG: hypothetical protein PHH37_06685 [Paludibacter sp.]|nr:hypothetical protein [Paludibacter sp.]